jgi:hypothetical protein
VARYLHARKTWGLSISADGPKRTGARDGLLIAWRSQLVSKICGATVRVALLINLLPFAGFDVSGVAPRDVVDGVIGAL